MIKIGITGGIGTGKSTVCSIFKCLGIPVFDADNEAKMLYTEDESLKQCIINEFGEGVYPNNIFDRKALAEIVFNSEEKIKRLNSFIHPMVLTRFEKWCQKQNSPYVIKEAALLIEAGSHHDLDKLILVISPIETRIQRVIKRDHSNRVEIMKRINKQMPEEEKKKYCDYQIQNDDENLLIPQVEKIHALILKLNE